MIPSVHRLALLLFAVLSVPAPCAAVNEVLCYTQRVTDAPSFNIYTGRLDANNPIRWQHTVPAGILASVVRVGLYIEAWDVDSPPVNDEHDRVYFNGHDLGLLEGQNETWITVEKTVPVEALREGLNDLQVVVDEMGKDWRVTIRASELRFYCRSAEPDFSLGVSPGEMVLRQGESGSARVTATGLNGFGSEISLTADQVPTGLSLFWNPSVVIPSPTAESGLTLQADQTMPAGTYELNLRGRDGNGKTHAVALRLVVEAGVVEPVYHLAIKAVPQRGRPPLDVAFRAVLEGDAPPPDIRYEWSFGDGVRGLGQKTNHLYGQAGVYPVVLRAFLADDKVLSARSRVEVLAFTGVPGLTFSPQEGFAGEEVVLVMTVQNPEPDDMQGLRLQMRLHDALHLLRVEGVTPVAGDGQKLDWTIPLLKAGETLDTRLYLRVDENCVPQVIGQVVHLLHAGLVQPVSSPEARLRILPPRLLLEKSVDRERVEPGQDLLYTLLLNNPTKARIAGCTLTDSLPEQLEIRDVQGPWRLDRRGSNLSWTGTLEAEATLSWTVLARVPPQAMDGDLYVNQGALTVPLLESPVTSNTVTSRVEGWMVQQGQVRLEHRAEIAQVDVGRIVRMRLVVDNRSASVLHQARLEVLLPSGVGYVPGSTLWNGRAAADPQGRGRLVWNLPAIAPGLPQTLYYQVVIGSSSRRGAQICRGELRALDGTRREVHVGADARLTLSAGGLTFPGGVEGVVFLDRDRDGFHSPGEEPLAGVEVLLSRGEGTVSDASGRYRLDNLYAGEYAVGINAATLDERFALPRPSTVLVTLGDGLTEWVELPVRLAAAGDRVLARLEGRVFFDRNRDGVWTEGSDPGVAVFQILLDKKVRCAGQQGRFVLTGQEPGTHRLAITVEGRTWEREIVLAPGRQTLDFPLPFRGIRIHISGAQK